MSLIRKTNLELEFQRRKLLNNVTLMNLMFFQKIHIIITDFPVELIQQEIAAGKVQKEDFQV